MLRSCYLIFIISMLATCFSRQAQATETDYVGQFQLSGAGTLELSELDDNASLGIFAQGAFLYPIGGSSPFLFGYVGLDLTAEKHNFKLLTGSFFDGEGASMLVSMWYTFHIDDDINFFAEFDICPNLQGHANPLMYVNSSLSYKFNDEVSVAVMGEVFASFDEMFELAVGPSVSIDHLTFWLAYDDKPNMKDLQTIMLRVSLKVPFNKTQKDDKKKKAPEIIRWTL